MFDQIHDLNTRAWELFQKNLPEAIRLSEQAAEQSQSAGAYGSPYLPGLAESYYQLGRFHLQLAHYDQALAFFAQAQQQSELLEDGDQLALIWNFIGLTYTHLGDYAEALQHLLKGLATARHNGNRPLEAAALNDIGSSLNAVGDFAGALPNLEQGLAIFRDLGDREGQAMTLDGLALAHLGLDVHDRALACAEESVALCRAVGARRREATHLGTVGRIHLAQNQAAAAEAALRAALDIARRYGYRLEEEVALRHLGGLQMQSNQPAQAQASLEGALSIAVEINARRNQYECHESLAALFRQKRDFAQALAHYEQFHTLKETVFNEQNEMRQRGLAIQRRLETAQKEAELYQLRSVELELEVGERRKAEAALQELAATDPLTGLANRRHVFELAEKAVAISRRYHNPLTIIMLDIDHFKTINDTHGHAVGDQVIVEFAERIRTRLRTSDILGRHGGDEFLIVLPQTDVAGAAPVLKRVQAAVTGMPVPIKDGEIPISTSIGLSSNESDYGLTLETLVERADAAMYSAKTAGRNRIQVYESAR